MIIKTNGYMRSKFNITTLTSQPQVIAALADLIIETVANGGSVNFMHPLAPQAARALCAHCCWLQNVWPSSRAARC